VAERIRLYTDEHVPKAVTRGLRERGVDVLTVSEAGMLGASDQGHLAPARQEGRVLFTQDADFLRLHTSGVGHSGIVYARQHYLSKDGSHSSQSCGVRGHPKKPLHL